MRAKTHIAGGALAAELLLMSIPDPSSALISTTVAASLAGALFPDIDNADSRISNRNLTSKIIGTIIQRMFRHRGPFHTPVFGFFFSGLIFVVLKYSGITTDYLLMSNAFWAGYLSHLILDTLNQGGIAWFWPLSKKRKSIAKIRTNSLWDWLIFFFIIAVDLAVGGLAMNSSVKIP